MCIPPDLQKMLEGSLVKVTKASFFFFLNNPQHIHSEAKCHLHVPFPWIKGAYVFVRVLSKYLYCIVINVKCAWFSIVRGNPASGPQRERASGERHPQGS